ncbi:MAG: hypothetical protein OYI31_05860 [Chloroflexota bacterium]|nr:hypothetical protein [Chloroflexota bacterium]MDE2942113.1 hypothetical protein [Chloroflexota bacterium]MDE3267959.1 hypothetical protein [Chloroflexota bacterium]
MYNAQAGRVLYARSDLSSFVSAAILSFLIFGGLFYAVLNWSERPADPAISFAAAFDVLNEMDSVYFTVEEEKDGGTGTFRFTNLGVLGIEISEHYFPADWDAFEQQTEEDCIVQDETYRYCVYRKRGTGEEVGQVEWGYSESTTVEGAFVRPDSVHYTETRKPDRPLRLSAPPGVSRMERPPVELLYVDGVTWSRTVGGSRYWHTSNADGLPGPIGVDLYTWGLLDASGSDLYFEGLAHVSGIEGTGLLDRYDNVKRLEDSELDGIPVERYLAASKVGSEALEIWVGKEDGLVRKISKRIDGTTRWDTFSSVRTYTFSRFNEPAEIPRPWPCFGAPGC